MVLFGDAESRVATIYTQIVVRRGRRCSCCLGKQAHSQENKWNPWRTKVSLDNLNTSPDIKDTRRTLSL
jgi:hypothetical protein